MSKRSGVVVQRKSDGYYLTHFHRETEGTVEMIDVWNKDMKDATVFAYLPEIVLCAFGINQSSLIVKQVFVEFEKSVHLVNEWNDIENVKPSHYEEVVVEINNTKRKAIWNSELNQFIDSSTMLPMESVTKWQRKVEV